MSIRLMAPADADQVLEIYQAAVDSGNSTFQSSAPAWDDFYAERLQAHCFVACEDDRVLGWITLKPYSTRPAYSGVANLSVFVHPDAQGRGVGRLLLDTVIASSEAAGIWTLLAAIIPENTASIRLHESAGFRLIGTHERMGRHTVNGTTRYRDVSHYERRSKLV